MDFFFSFFIYGPGGVFFFVVVIVFFYRWVRLGLVDDIRVKLWGRCYDWLVGCFFSFFAQGVYFGRDSFDNEDNRAFVPGRGERASSHLGCFDVCFEAFDAESCNIVRVLEGPGCSFFRFVFGR